MLFIPGAEEVTKSESAMQQVSSEQPVTPMEEMHNMPPMAPMYQMPCPSYMAPTYQTPYMPYFAPMYQTPCPSNYVVNPGDTLWNISNRFGVPIDEIIKANNFMDPNMICPGQTIAIPSPPATAPMPPSPPPYDHTKEDGTVYVVKPGDTIYAIAKRFNTTVDAILGANPEIQNLPLVYPGQRLIMPDMKEPENVDKTQSQSETKSEDDSEKLSENKREKPDNNNDEKEKTIQ